MSVESTVCGRSYQSLGLIETLRYQPQRGCERAERHLSRMSTSAQHFGKRFDRDEAAHRLNAIQGEAPLRVRLYLDEDDVLSCSTHPFVPLEHGKVWRITIASTRLDATNHLLAHKTSLRQVYEVARAEFDSGQADEVLLLNQHDHVCEGTITNVFVHKGNTLVTPPLADGLLRGVLRQEMLDTQKAIEGTITLEDLRQYTFFVGNSLRGLIPAILADYRV